MRFILVCFAVMAFAFYELSGGSDFDPDAVRAARMAELEMDEPTPKVVTEPVVVAEAPKVFVDTDPPTGTDVTRVSLNLTTLETATEAANVTVVQDDVTAAVEEAIAEVPQNVSIVTTSADTPAIIPSLIDPDEGATDAAQEPIQIVGFDDIRTVSGNRVNVRGGPGTDFGVVGRLARGDEIKVLEDDGQGWVRFETPDGLTAGWMADFLLTNG